MVYRVRARETEEDERFLDEMNYMSFRVEFIRDRQVTDEEARRMYREWEEKDPLDPWGPGHMVYFADAGDGSPAGVVWVAERQPFYVFENPLGWIYNLHVAPGYRRKGVARLLLGEAETWARGRGFQSIGLHVADFNEPALRLYESQGYRLVGAHDWSRFYEKRLV